MDFLRLLGSTVVMVSALGMSRPALAQLFVEQEVGTANDAAMGDGFGRALSMQNGTLLVGAQTVDLGAEDQGAVYVFGLGSMGWTQLAKLSADDGTANDRFGFSVALDAGTAIIGAHTDNFGAFQTGSAYVFTGSGSNWTQLQKLGASDASMSDTFGGAVDISGDYLVVGAKDASGTGAAYVFVRNGGTWSEQQKLVPNDGANNDKFGEAVAISGDTIAVGAFAHDTPVSNGGAAYVYTRSGSVWSLQQKLQPSDVEMDDYYGRYLDLDGDTLAVGSTGDHDNGDASGSVRVYTRSGGNWTEQQKLLASDGAPIDVFGAAVRLKGDRLLIGGPNHDHLVDDGGAAYFFTRSGNTWTEQRKLVFSDPGPMDRFGNKIAFDGDWAATSGGFADIAVTDGGAVAFYDLTTPSNNGTGCGQGDSCTSGLCVDGVCCNSVCGGGVPDDCQSCAANGLCELETGTSCDDGDLCTQTDTCNAGSCIGADPLVCTALDECHLAGSCDPLTGVCDDPEQVDGTPCTDGVCEMGVCTPESTGGAGGVGGMGVGEGGAGGMGAAGGGGGEPQDEGGCSCRTAAAPAGGGWLWLAALGALGVWRRRRFRSRRDRPTLTA